MSEYKVFEIPDGWVVRKISKGGRLMETVAIFPASRDAKKRAMEYKDFCDRRDKFQCLEPFTTITDERSVQ